MLFVYRTDFGQNLRYFCPIYTYNSAVFRRIILQDKLIATIHYSGRWTEARAFLAQQIVKFTTT